MTLRETFLGFVIALGISQLGSQVACAAGSEQEHRLTMYTARDLCTGPIAKFANTPDPDSSISYDAGEFKVVRAKGSITILKNDVVLEKVDKFDYSKYIDCIKSLTLGGGK